MDVSNQSLGPLGIKGAKLVLEATTVQYDCLKITKAFSKSKPYFSNKSATYELYIVQKT
jgi:hypothetical protein